MDDFASVRVKALNINCDRVFPLVVVGSVSHNLIIRFVVVKDVLRLDGPFEWIRCYYFYLRV